METRTPSQGFVHTLQNSHAPLQICLFSLSAGVSSTRVIVPGVAGSAAGVVLLLSLYLCYRCCGGKGTVVPVGGDGGDGGGDGDGGGGGQHEEGGEGQCGAAEAIFCVAAVMELANCAE